ncbi:SMI1/KNR4 family protein [Streptomyces sp. NPDC127033]|uniref:SMI1/KNR4 family protein n=1 Tax=Streptomyces sp. NPDC127033 TaxID=3347110 RepID=UPI003657277B
MKTYNWRPFLERWSADWAGSPGARARADSDPGPDAPGERWLGFAGAGPERIGALEERLGPDVVLPPTFRSFLAVTDGWRPAGTGLRLLGTAEGTRWYGDPQERDGLWGLDGLWGRALQLRVESDGAVDGAAGLAEVLLDPGDVNADGEWAAYLHRPGSCDAPDRYESFMELMQALFRSFHRTYRNTPGFENDTTRELDAEVEEARLGCLRGAAADASLKVFTEAAECGRPRARGLRVEVEALLNGGGTRDRGTAGRTFRYEAPGPFGAAVDAAREQARWGDTGAAWDTLAAAVAFWEPYGDEHLGPVGLLADPLLGPVLTPERGRYLLETPRGAEGREPGAGAGAGAGAGGGSGAGGGVEEGAGVSWDDGLAWLADEPSPAADREGGYRFVFVRGVPPEELARRIGRGPLLAPAGEDELTGDLSGPEEPEHGERRPVARVGRCRDGWSFAYESRAQLSEAFLPERLSGLGESASVGAESVTVWCERGDRPSAAPGAFHFSYAEDGQRVYGFTVRGEEIEQWGELPGSLDPEELFPAYEEYEEDDAYDEDGDGDEGGQGAGVEPLGLDPDDEYEALAALSDEFGISLPEFALRHGRLHTVRMRPWLRPPGAGADAAEPAAGGDDLGREPS